MTNPIRQPQVLPLIRMGHPTLAKKAVVVADPTAVEIKYLVDDMFATLDAIGGGAGLAAPQMDISLRVMIFNVPQDRAVDCEPIPLTAAINPMIISTSEEMKLGWEACFSLPKMMGKVARHQFITYRYQTLSGETVLSEAQGFHARVIQHEVDHLDGIIYVQRIKDMMNCFGCIDEIKQYMLGQ